MRANLEPNYLTDQMNIVASHVGSIKKNYWRNILFRYYNTYQYMLKAYPKAAKHERVRKKWYNRWGGGLTEEIQKSHNNTFFGLMPKSDFTGGSIVIPLNFSDEVVD